jgi:hypothetical protein
MKCNNERETIKKNKKHEKLSKEMETMENAGAENFSCQIENFNGVSTTDFKNQWTQRQDI